MSEEQEKLPELSEEDRKAQFRAKMEEEQKRLPRIADKVLVDPEWTEASLEPPKFTLKARILGVTEKSYFVRYSSGITQTVPHGALKLNYD